MVSRRHPGADTLRQEHRTAGVRLSGNEACYMSFNRSFVWQVISVVLANADAESAALGVALFLFKAREFIELTAVESVEEQPD